MPKLPKGIKQRKIAYKKCLKEIKAMKLEWPPEITQVFETVRKFEEKWFAGNRYTGPK